MRWLRFMHRGQPAVGQLLGDEVLVHEGALFHGAAPRATGERVPLAGLAWLAPCVPGQIVGLWNNFRAAAAQNGWAEPAEPLYFPKSPHSAAAHEQPIEALPPEAGRVAYEGSWRW